MSEVFTKTKNGLRQNVTSKVWYMNVRINGVHIRKSLETQDRATALRKLGDERKEHSGRKGEITFEDLAARYLLTRKGVKESTRSNDEWAINRIKNEAPFARKYVSKIQPSEYAVFRAEMKLKARANNNFVGTLTAVLKLGVADGYLSFNPIERLPKQKIKWVRQEPPAPTPEQHLAIVADIRSKFKTDRNEETADWVEFLGLAGIGEAEAAFLDWKDFDWKGRKFTAHKQRTGSDPFPVPFYVWLEPLIMRLWKKAGKPKKGPVFKLKSAKQAIYNSCRRLELPDFSPRSFRQMLIVRSLRQGLPVKLVSKYQGHKDGGVLILRYYTQVISETDSNYERDQLARLAA